MARKRIKHTFIIVLGTDDHKENKTMEALKELDDVISRKIREKKCIETSQTTLYVKNTCKNIKNEHIMQNENGTFIIKLSQYFKCPVNMDDLHVNLFLLNFNPSKKTAACKYSKHGSFYVGVGEIQNENRSDTQNGWFLVNHLETAILSGTEKNCSKN